VTFLAKCAPAGSMIVVISTFDRKISTPGDFQTYRSPGTYFSCNEQGVPVSLDIKRFALPEWWFEKMKLDLSDRAYTLDKVAKIVFGTSATRPRNVESYLEVSELTLRGRDYRYIAALALAILASALGFAAWFLRAHARALVASVDCKIKKDLPLVAYRQLTMEPYKDKEKASVLRFIATNYTNPELDLEGVASETGANRNKVNEVLKAELGMTFTSYLNKLRLTEAARLLAEKDGAAVAMPTSPISTSCSRKNTAARRKPSAPSPRRRLSDRLRIALAFGQKIDRCNHALSNMLMAMQGHYQSNSTRRRTT
jgi:AraC-like DNA-binding protein